MTSRLAPALNRVLAAAARLLPADRRPWIDAIRAEADQIPARGQRLSWLTGGFLLIAKEVGMNRKIGYWIGVAGLTAAIALVMWTSWRAAGPADAENVTDRVRILIGAGTLAALPWIGRGRGWFGPVAGRAVTRYVRIAGCAAICAMGLGLVHADRHAGINGVGTGHFSWLRETAGLVFLVATVAVPLMLKARRHAIGAEAYWMIALLTGSVACILLPVQAFVAGTAALLFAATSRRAAVTAATWTAALIAGLPTAVAACVLPFALGNLFGAIFLVALVAALSGGCAGAVSARLVPETGDPDVLRAPRIRQGALTGALAGAIGGLASAAFSLILGEMIIVGLMAGFGGGVLGALIAIQFRARSTQAGMPALQPELQ
jgi:hypothetical protein